MSRAGPGRDRAPMTALTLSADSTATATPSADPTATGTPSADPPATGTLSADATATGAPSAEPTAVRALMSAVLDAALDAVVAIDGGGRVVEWNPAAERMFGYGAADALGRELAALIVPAELRDRHRAGLARHVAGGSPALPGRSIELTARRASGARFPAELTITRVAVDGEALFVACVRDMGDRRRAEAQ